MIKTYKAMGRGVQTAEVWGQITRADGTVEENRLLARYESVGHKLRRIGRKVLPWLALALVAGAALQEPVREVVERHGHVIGTLGAPVVGGLGATLIVNGGHALSANRIIGSGTEPKYVAWGTGAGTAAASDTTLFTESTDEARTSGTSSRVTTTVTNDTYQVVGTITVATSNKTITNVGLFDASTSGNLWFKSDFTGLALLVGDAIQFTIKVKFS